MRWCKLPIVVVSCEKLLIGKGPWDLVSGYETRLIGETTIVTLGRVARRGIQKAIVKPRSIEEQKKWDKHDGQALVVITLCCKRNVITHIHSCK